MKGDEESDSMLDCLLHCTPPNMNDAHAKQSNTWRFEVARSTGATPAGIPPPLPPGPLSSDLPRDFWNLFWSQVKLVNESHFRRQRTQQNRAILSFGLGTFAFFLMAYFLFLPDFIMMVFVVTFYGMAVYNLFALLRVASSRFRDLEVLGTMFQKYHVSFRLECVVETGGKHSLYAVLSRGSTGAKADNDYRCSI